MPVQADIGFLVFLPGDGVLHPWPAVPSGHGQRNEWPPCCVIRPPLRGDIAGKVGIRGLGAWVSEGIGAKPIATKSLIPSRRMLGPTGDDDAGRLSNPASHLLAEVVQILAQRVNATPLAGNQLIGDSAQEERRAAIAKPDVLGVG